ncbi:Cof-type HAD-IIB family hydrolase [Clostridium ganghwense]|uniref:Cof-type HAD-IIB family hydrolase n=1 Tax=Clostridium ganghwense TaxID=312089 RepID=A0ABT4CLE5_9CLOT|nr:Cof-type HAD-IIB family hydrolase [Clostridium ganghwense]MCY6369870.1 Cof-type HAD-IIB family hydrolase [Clostridium ganghwense]
MYKLLALDMDGTLLDNNQKISKENIEAIQKAKELGVKVVLTTGRAIGGIEEYLKELDLISEDNYSVTCSGALILNNTKKEIIECNNISHDEFKFTFNLAEELNITLNIYSNDGILVPSHSIFSHFDSVANNLPLKIADFNSLDEETVINKITLINEDLSIAEQLSTFFPSICLKDIHINANQKFDKDLFEDVSNLPIELLENFTILKTSPYTLEVLNKNCNKGTGVKRMAEELGIKQEEIICIGDSGNDKHMIEYAGLGVAMGNAFTEIKEIADYVTYTNEENGVAHIIQKFILNEQLGMAD